jgi:PKD domain
MLFALCLAAAISAGPASAVVTSVGGLQFGVQPETSAKSSITKPLSYENGPVVYRTAPYAIYWDPHTGRYRGSWEELISGFLANAGEDSGSLRNNFAVITQYHDTTGGRAQYDLTFHGAYTDTDPFPAANNCSEPAPCLTDAQVRTELTKYIDANGLPAGVNPSSGVTPIYFLFTPPGVSVCLEGSGEHGHCSSQSSANPLCSYHSFIPPGGSRTENVLYAVEPWTAGNLGTLELSEVSGKGCQDGEEPIEEPNQIGLGPEGEYSTGLGDLIVNNVADQALSTATDPLLNGWHDTGADTKEVVDKCRNDFLGGENINPATETPDKNTKAGHRHNQTIGGTPYYLNDVFDQAAWYAAYPGVPCINNVHVHPEFTAQNKVRSGDVATFNATESDVSLGIAKYTWSFGDGTGTNVDCEGRVPTNGFGPQECTSTSGTNITNPVASTDHVYAYGGTYEVTLTVTDDGGNEASTSHNVTVEGPPPPAPASQTSTAAAPGTNGSTSGGTTSGGTTASGTNGSTTPQPQVVATQAVVSTKLSSALRSGLVVRYSVSQQVAGRFEVLLASSIARRIRLHGPSATGLAKGTPPQTVIAKAILVTTKGGRGTYKITFSKTTASRLRKLHKVTLMIRMVVHNATSPVATTVLNTVNLH